MSDWEVTDLGHEILKKNGLDRRIDEEWRTIVQQLSYGNNSDSIITSGKIADIVLTKEESANPQRFGVNPEQLKSLIAAYCVAKRSIDPFGYGNFYTWRSNGYRTQIYGDKHGYLTLSQINTKPNDEAHLFGKLPESRIYANYDYWPILVATALKFADTVKAEIPEVKGWRQLLAEKGWDGTIISRFGSNEEGYRDFVYNYTSQIIAQISDKTDAKHRNLFFGEMSSEGDDDARFLPVIDLEENLVFCCNLGEGPSINITSYGTVEQFYPRIYVPKADAGHLFVGSVNGIMTGQSRLNPGLLALMFWQYEQLKAGRPEDEIIHESHRFPSK
jgi:hypothetical protein